MSNYAKIKTFDIANGTGVRTSIFFSGCEHYCENCFNKELWDFNVGEPFNRQVYELKIKPTINDYISGISLLGGEPLHPNNLSATYDLIKWFKEDFPDKNIWLYTGYTLNGILYPVVTDDLNPERDKILELRKNVVSICDVIVDGKYVDELRDLTLRFRGSINQGIWKKQGNGFINTTKV